MKKVQARLKECVETQTMSVESLKRLSTALHTTAANDSAVEDTIMSSTSILTDELVAAKAYKGENKAPTKKGVQKKSKKSKHNSTTAPEKKEKKRPRYFVQF